MSKSEPNNQLKKLLKSFCLGEGKVTIESDIATWSMHVGLGSIVYDYGILQTDDESVINELAANNLTTQFWFQTQLDATKKIIQALNDVDITPTLIKGMSISTNIYPKHHYRVMRDIDILVDLNEIKQIEKILPVLGYKQTSSLPTEFYQTHHHTMPWQHAKDDVWLEVHQKLFTHTSACFTSPVFQLDNIKSEKVVDEFYGLKIYRLSYELQIIYIASHWAEQFKQVGGVFALLEVALIINKHNTELDWGKIISWANTAHVSNYVYVLLQYLNNNNFLKSDVNIKNSIRRIDHRMGLLSIFLVNKIIDDYFFAGKRFGRFMSISNVSSIWIHLLGTSLGLTKVIVIPFVIIFPKGVEGRFNIKFQFSRLVSLFKLKNP